MLKIMSKHKKLNEIKKSKENYLMDLCDKEKINENK